jgi:hypothetical protein
MTPVDRAIASGYQDQVNDHDRITVVDPIGRNWVRPRWPGIIQRLTAANMFLGLSEESLAVRFIWSPSELVVVEVKESSRRVDDDEMNASRDDDKVKSSKVKWEHRFISIHPIFSQYELPWEPVDILVSIFFL